MISLYATGCRFKAFRKLPKIVFQHIDSKLLIALPTPPTVEPIKAQGFANIPVQRIGPPLVKYGINQACPVGWGVQSKQATIGHAKPKVLGDTRASAVDRVERPAHNFELWGGAGPIHRTTIFSSSRGTATLTISRKLMVTPALTHRARPFLAWFVVGSPRQPTAERPAGVQFDVLRASTTSGFCKVFAK